MPVAKLSPISQATISITPWMPNVNISDSTGSPVKLRMPSQVVHPPASDRTKAAEPSSVSCQLVKNIFSTTLRTRRPKPDSASAIKSARSASQARAGGDKAATPDKNVFDPVTRSHQIHFGLPPALRYARCASAMPCR